MKNILIKVRNNHEQLFRIFLFLLTLVIIIYVFPRQAKFKYEFTKGKPWMHETIIAPFDFSILKAADEIKIEQEIIRSEHTPIFNYNADIFLLKVEDYIDQFEEKWVKDKDVKKDDKFTFFWDGSEETATLKNVKKGESVKFQWDDDEGDDYYFEMAIRIDDLTKEVALIITDFYEEDEDELRLLWDNNIHKLKQAIGG